MSQTCFLPLEGRFRQGPVRGGGSAGEVAVGAVDETLRSFDAFRDRRPCFSAISRSLLAMESNVAFCTADILLVPEASVEQELAMGMRVVRLTWGVV